MRTVRDGWDSYYEDLLKPSGVLPGTTQYRETRRAFYAGARYFFDLSEEISCESSEDAGVAMFQTLDEEFDIFVSGLSNSRDGN